MRSDAISHRRKLIATAAKVMRERGHAVPLQEIADQAGLGRGTLYRHFPDRDALIMAVIEHELDTANELIEACPDGRALFFEFLETHSASAAVFVPALLSLDNVRLRLFYDSVNPRYERLLGIVVKRAREAGLIRPDFTADDMALVIQMLGSFRGQHIRGYGEISDRLVNFLMCGIGLSDKNDPQSH